MPCGAALEERRDRARPDRVPGAGQAGAAACAQKAGHIWPPPRSRPTASEGSGLPDSPVSPRCLSIPFPGAARPPLRARLRQVQDLRAAHAAPAVDDQAARQRQARPSELRANVGASRVRPTHARLPLPVVGTRGLGSENAPRPPHLPSPQRGKPYEEAWRAGHSTVSELDPPTRDPSSERDHSQTSASSTDNK